MTIYKFADAYCTTCKTITKQNDNTSLFVCQKCNTKNSPLNFDGTPHPISWKKKEDIPALKYSVLNTDCMTKDQVITALDNEISTWKSLLESNKKEDIPATYSELKHYLSWAERWMFRLLETNPELFRDFDRNRMAKIRELTNDNGHHEIDQIFRSGKEDIQPVLRWVKAEERLPDERPGWSHSADVNILLRNVKDETHPLFVSTGAYRYLGVKKWCEYLYGDRLDKGDFEVVAWQPLPAAELSPSQDVPKSEELGNIRKQSLIELMEADQRDGMYGVRASINHDDYIEPSPDEMQDIKALQEAQSLLKGNCGANNQHKNTVKLLSDFADFIWQNGYKYSTEISGYQWQFKNNFQFFRSKDLAKRFLSNRPQNVQASDTTEDHSSNSATK